MAARAGGRYEGSQGRKRVEVGYVEHPFTAPSPAASMPITSEAQNSALRRRGLSEIY